MPEIVNPTKQRIFMTHLKVDGAKWTIKPLLKLVCQLLSQGHLDLFPMYQGLNYVVLLSLSLKTQSNLPRTLIFENIIKTWSKKKRKRSIKPPKNKQQCSLRFNFEIQRISPQISSSSMWYFTSGRSLEFNQFLNSPYLVQTQGF